VTETIVNAPAKEEAITRKLVESFPFLADKVKATRPRRIFAVVNANDFENVLVFAMRELGFTILCTITGLDNGPTLGFIYHITRQDGITLNIQYDVPKENPVINTVTKYFPPAEIYERELVDLLGARVEGLGEGARYPLPDDWPAGEYPLRKGWKSKRNTEEGKAKDA
jgi:membrane-bound hydrogenase subunit beta